MQLASGPAATEIAAPQLEAALFGVLLSAETIREGADAILGVFEPLLDDVSCALALRDRDGRSLHVLAERGAPLEWPCQLQPEFLETGLATVDPDTGSTVVPLRAYGRVIGALMLAGTGGALVGSWQHASLLDAAAAVLHALAARNDAELQRRATSLRSLDAIADGMAHQIANPLTGASAIAQLLEAEVADEGQRAAVQQIRHELARAFGVLSDVLEFHRDTHAQDGTVDLNEIVERMVRFRGYSIRESGITLEFDTHVYPVPVHVDVRGLEHALLTSLHFAERRSHGSVNRHIAVRVVSLGSAECCVEITDSGAGDVPSLAPRYFDIVHHGPEHPAGMAIRSCEPDLGLVRSILGGCGGRLEVRASKLDGTTLTLVLPRATDRHESTRPASCA